MSETNVDQEIELATSMEVDRNIINLILYKDGSIAFSKDHAETFVYLYKDQVAKLMSTLAERKTP